MTKIKNNIDWSKPPIDEELPDFKFPEFKKILIDENINTYYYQDEGQPLVTFKMIFHRGTADEPTAGISQITFDLLTSGTENHSSFEFATELDYLGASLSTNAGKDYSIVKLTCLKEVFEPAFKLFKEAVLMPKFDDIEVQKSIKKFISIKEQEEAEPGYLANIGLDAGLFRGHPYGNPSFGHLDEIRGIDRKDIINNYNLFLTNFKFSFVIAGNIGEEEATQKTLEVADNLESKSSEIEKPEILEKENNKLVLIDHKGSKQTIINVGKVVINLFDESYPAAKLVNTILGGYFLSRLNKLIREQKGLTYGVHSSLSSTYATGILSVSTSVNTSFAYEVVNDILEEMSSISNEMLEDEEVERARKYLLGTFLRSVENFKQVSKLMTTIAAYGISENYYSNFYNRIKNVGVDELFNVQIDHFRPQGIVLSLAGNSKHLLKDFSNSFDRIEILDKEGDLLERIENNNE